MTTSLKLGCDDGNDDGYCNVGQTVVERILGLQVGLGDEISLGEVLGTVLEKRVGIIVGTNEGFLVLGKQLGVDDKLCIGDELGTGPVLGPSVGDRVGFKDGAQNGFPVVTGKLGDDDVLAGCALGFGVMLVGTTVNAMEGTTDGNIVVEQLGCVADISVGNQVEGFIEGTKEG